MIVQLSFFNGKTFEQIKRFYASLPITEGQLELVGNFKETSSEITHAAKALSFLPRHIKSVRFSGAYAVREERRPGPQVGHDAYADFYVEVIHIGEKLPYYVSYLPKTVNRVVFAFTNNYEPDGRFEFCIRALLEAVSKLGPHVSELDLSSTIHNTIPAGIIKNLFQSIKETIKTLEVKVSPLQLLNSIAGMPSSVINLSIIESGLHQLTQAQLILFLNRLSRDLSYLNCPSNRLGTCNAAWLNAFFSNLPPRLIGIGLGQNQLERFHGGLRGLAPVVTKIQTSIEEIDVSGNFCLLQTSEDLSEFLHAFPSTVTRLKIGDIISERRAAVLRNDVLDVIPPQMNTLIVSQMYFFNLSIERFLEILQNTPETMDTLDLSNVGLNTFSEEELILLFSSIPPWFKNLKISDNLLVSIELEVLKNVFEYLSTNIIWIDCSNNGFDTLPSSQTELYLDIFPDHVKYIKLDKNFVIQNDGSLIVRPSEVNHPGLFRPQGFIKHNKAIANTMLFLMHQYSHGIPLDLLVHILSFNLGELTGTEISSIKKQLNTPLIPSTRPKKITRAHIRECVHAISVRIEDARQSGATRLNLSRCGLNRIDDTEIIKNQFKTISVATTELILRGNGLGQSDDTIYIAIELLGFIPESISFVDLSDNGFEHYNAEQLTELFTLLPDNVALVTLGQEKPLSPKDQIAVRKWPVSYNRLISNHTTPLQRARAILNDYTKGDSLFFRLLFLHWNRHHVAEVALLVYLIDLGVINNTADVINELELINKSNEIGSLARRAMFFSSDVAKTRFEERKKCQIEEVNEDEEVSQDEGVDLSVELSGDEMNPDDESYLSEEIYLDDNLSLSEEINHEDDMQPSLSMA